MDDEVIDKILSGLRRVAEIEQLILTQITNMNNKIEGISNYLFVKETVDMVFNDIIPDMLKEAEKIVPSKKKRKKKKM